MTISSRQVPNELAQHSAARQLPSETVVHLLGSIDSQDEEDPDQQPGEEDCLLEVITEGNTDILPVISEESIPAFTGDVGNNPTDYTLLGELNAPEETAPVPEKPEDLLTFSESIPTSELQAVIELINSIKEVEPEPKPNQESEQELNQESEPELNQESEPELNQESEPERESEPEQEPNQESEAEQESEPEQEPNQESEPEPDQEPNQESEPEQEQEQAPEVEQNQGTEEAKGKEETANENEEREQVDAQDTEVETPLESGSSFDQVVDVVESLPEAIQKVADVLSASKPEENDTPHLVDNVTNLMTAVEDGDAVQPSALLLEGEYL